MEEMNGTHPVEYLKEIEECCRSCGVSNDVNITDDSNDWTGISYRLGSDQLVSQLGEVVEILDVPELSGLPLTQPWVRGIANIRGNLLPVIDLCGCLTGSVTRLTDKTRILVIDYNGIYSGLVVDEVLGLRHFMDDEYSAEDAGVEEYLAPYTKHVFRRGENVWAVFSLHTLADSPQFLQAAV